MVFDALEIYIARDIRPQAGSGLEGFIRSLFCRWRVHSCLSVRYRLSSGIETKGEVVELEVPGCVEGGQ